MAEAKAPKGKSKLLLVIIIGVVLVLVIAGGAAAFLMMHNSSDGADDGGDPSTHQSKSKADKKKSDHPPIFEKLSQFTVNLNSPDQQVMLQTDIVVEMADATSEEDLKNLLPKVQNEVNKLLRSKTPDDMKAPNSTDKLGNEIRQSINKVLGVHADDQGVLSVNFTTFIVQ